MSAKRVGCNCEEIGNSIEYEVECEVSRGMSYPADDNSFSVEIVIGEDRHGQEYTDRRKVNRMPFFFEILTDVCNDCANGCLYCSAGIVLGFDSSKDLLTNTSLLKSAITSSSFP